MTTDNRSAEHWFFYLVFCLSLLLGWYWQRDAASFKSPLGAWSDRAGYYIYLPALFHFGFDARSMPPDLDIATGGGFSIDTVSNKLDTKYTYGVALMLAPFFGMAEGIAALAGYDAEDGFSMIHMRMMLVAAAVYLTLGMWFLYRFLRKYLPPGVSMATLAVLYTGTNLLYYTLVEGMMSHVFSFFLFSLFLWSVQSLCERGRTAGYILSLAILSLAVLLRPTNLIIGLCLLFPFSGGPEKFSERLRPFLRPAVLVPSVFIILILVLPQIIYWKYLSGHWIHFSYRNEGFHNLFRPALPEVLFSPVNGLFIYTPLVLFMLAGVVIMYIKKIPGRWSILTIFLMVTMICASWSMWYFGCSYGQRSYIEYYTLLALPLGYFLAWLHTCRSMLIKTFVMFAVLFTVAANVRYISEIYRHQRCWFGSTWDWERYRHSLIHAGIIPGRATIRSVRNDFENLAIFPGRKPSRIFTRSGQCSLHAGVPPGKTVLWEGRLYEFGYPWPKVLEAGIWIYQPGTIPSGAQVAFSVFGDDRLLIRDTLILPSSPGKWKLVSHRFIIPDVNDTAALLQLTLDNPLTKPLFADDLSIHFFYHWNELPGL